MRRVLTDIALARLEVRHRRWYRRVAHPFTEGRLRTLFPYGVYAIGIWLFLLPYLAVLAGIAGLVMVVAPDVLAEEMAAVQADPLYVAALIAGVYAVALVAYRPIDKNDYGPDGNSTPTNYEEFEMLMTFMGFSAFPLTYFLLLWFEAETAPYLESVGLSPFLGAVGGMVVGQGLVYLWLRHRYKHKNTRVCPELATFWGSQMFYVPVMLLYFAQIPLGFDLVLYGSPAEPLGATFAVVMVWMALTMRRLRWTVNVDYFGYPRVNPFVPVWGLPRVAFVFAVAAVWLDAPLSELVVGATLAPLGGGLVYIGWRAYVTGDLKTPPHGWLSSPGRKTYEKQRRKNDQKMAEIARAREAVQEFNELAASYGWKTLPEPGITEYDPQALRETLDAIDKRDARALTGEEFNEYARLRDAVREKVK